jgi:hypothetical protein
MLTFGQTYPVKMCLGEKMKNLFYSRERERERESEFTLSLKLEMLFLPLM